MRREKIYSTTLETYYNNNYECYLSRIIKDHGKMSEFENWENTWVFQDDYNNNNGHNYYYYFSKLFRVSTKLHMLSILYVFIEQTQVLLIWMNIFNYINLITFNNKKHWWFLRYNTVIVLNLLLGLTCIMYRNEKFCN